MADIQNRLETVFTANTKALEQSFNKMKGRLKDWANSTDGIVNKTNIAWKQAEATQARYNQVLQNSKEKIEIVKKSMMVFRQSISSNIKKINEKQQAIKDLEEQNKKLENRQKFLNYSIKQSSEQSKEYRKNLTELDKTIAETALKKKELGDQIKKNNTQIKKSTDIIANRYTPNLKELTNSETKYKNKLKDRQSVIDEIKNKILKLSVEERKANLFLKTKAIPSQIRFAKAIENKKDEISKYVRTLDSELQAQYRANGINAIARKGAQKYSKELATLEKKQLALKEAVKKATETIEKAPEALEKKRIEETKAQIILNNTKKTLNEYKKEIGEVQKKMNNINETIKSYSQTNKNLNEDLKNVKNSEKALGKEKQKKINIISAIKTSLQKIQKEYEKYDNTIKRNNYLIELNKSGIRSAIVSNLTKEISLKRLKKQEDGYNQTISNTNSRLEILKQKMSLLDPKITHLRQLINNLKNTFVVLGSYIQTFGAIAISTFTAIGRSITNSIQNSFNLATNSIRGYINKTVDASKTLLQSLSIIGTVGGYAFEKLASETQSLSNKILSVSTSVEDSNKTFYKLNDVANMSRSNISDLSSVFLKFEIANKQMGISSEESLRQVETVSKGLKLQGASASESAAALLQLSQAYASGRLQGDEFRSLTENFPLLLTYVAKSIGVTTDKVRELSKDGAITTKVLRKAFEQMAEDVDDKFNKLPIVVGDSFVILRNKIVKSLYSINQNTKILDNLALSIVKFGDTIDKYTPFIERFIISLDVEKLKLMAGVVLGALTPALVSLGLAFAGALLFLSPFMIAGYLVANNFEDLKNKAIELTGGIEGLKTQFNQFKNEIQIIIDGVVKSFQEKMEVISNTVIPALRRAFEKIQPKLDDYKEILSNISDIANNVFELGMIAIGKAIDGISVIITNPLFTSALKTITDFFADFTSVEKWKKALQDIGEHLEKYMIWYESFSIAMIAIAGAFLVIKTQALITAFWSALVILTPILWAAVPALWSVAAGVIAATWPLLLIVIAIIAVIAAIIWVVYNFEWLKEQAGKIWEFIKKQVQNVWNQIKIIFSIAWEYIKTVFNNIFNIIKQTISTVIDWFKDKIAKVPGIINDIIEKAKTAATDFGNAIKDNIKAGIEVLLSWITEKFEWITKKTKEIVDGAKNAAKSTGSAIVNTPGNVANWVGGLFRASGGPVSASQPYIVGDNPDGTLNSTSELFVPKVNGNIYSAKDTRKMLSGGNNVYITNNYGQGLNGATKSQIESLIIDNSKAIKDILNKHGKTNISFTN